MKELPILFSTPMVQAILAGTKTQTRRVVDKEMPPDWQFERMDERGAHFFWNPISRCFIPNRFGKPGDILWVRESWAIIEKKDVVTSGWLKFKADFEGPVDWKWKPSIHMPKDISRIWLKKESIRIERLNDISEEDAKAEGIEQPRADSFWKNYLSKDGATFYNPVDSYQSLWNSINGPDSWNTNPWVWVITFKVLSTTGKPKTLPRE